MKCYEVTIKYLDINRKNRLIVWAQDRDSAIRQALKWWGNPSKYEWIEAIDTKY